MYHWMCKLMSVKMAVGGNSQNSRTSKWSGLTGHNWALTSGKMTCVIL